MLNLKLLDTSNYHKKRGQVTLTYKGIEVVSGEVNFSRTANITDDDHYTNELAQKTLAYSNVDQLDFELDIEFLEVGSYALMIAFLSDVLPTALAATTGNTTPVYAKLTADQVIRLGIRSTNVVVTDGANGGTTYVLGTDYNLTDGDNGFTFVNPLPSMYGKNATVTYDTRSATANVYHPGQNTAIEFQVLFQESILNPALQTPETHIYYRVQLRPDQITYTGSDSDPRSVATKGKCLPDTTKPTGQQIGVIYANVQPGV